MPILSLLAALLLAPLATVAFGTESLAATVHPLDGDGWRIATDPKNEGREAKWFAAPREEAKTDEGALDHPGRASRVSRRGA